MEPQNPNHTESGYTNDETVIPIGFTFEWYVHHVSILSIDDSIYKLSTCSDHNYGTQFISVSLDSPSQSGVHDV